MGGISLPVVASFASAVEWSAALTPAQYAKQLAAKANTMPEDSKALCYLKREDIGLAFEFSGAVAVSTPPRIMSSMATRSKRRSRTQGAKSTRPVGDPSRPSARPFLRFYHSEELHERTILVLATLESAGDPTAHRDALAELAVELTNSGLHYYFVKPLKVAKAGFILEQSASIGMAGVQQVMAAVIRNIIARMDGPQLLSVGNSLRQFMR